MGDNDNEPPELFCSEALKHLKISLKRKSQYLWDTLYVFSNIYQNILLTGRYYHYYYIITAGGDHLSNFPSPHVNLPGALRSPLGSQPRHHLEGQAEVHQQDQQLQE